MQRFARRTTPATESRILKLKGLPYATKEGDLQDFFQNFKLLRVALVSEPDGRPSGLAFAEFESSEEAVRAMSARNGDYIGDRYVKLLRVPPEEMEEQTGGMGGGMLGSSPAGGMFGMSSGFGMQPSFAPGPGMRPQQPGQLPPAAWAQRNSAAEQSGFGQQHGQPPLDGFGVSGQQQGFGLAGQQGAFGGPGQVGWSPMTAPQAFGGYNPMQPQQHGSGFNGHQHKMFSGRNGSEALGSWPGNEADGGALPLSLQQDHSQNQKPIAVLIAEQQAALREVQRAAATAAAPSYQQAALGGSSSGMLQFQQQALPIGGPLGMSMGMSMGMGIPGGVHSATPPMGQEQASPGQHGLAGHHHPANSGSFGSSGELAPRSQQRLVKTDGSTIKVRGLPFRAAREEILAFFDGYGVLRDTLFLGTDGRGRPSGEGWLTFESPDEALRCARERNRQYLGSRYLELSLC